MSAPKPFQEHTVAKALAAVRDPDGSRRFLVADEVGLGKTIVAQQVIRHLMEGRTDPLRVFYVCSNLAIAGQNRAKLLEVLDTADKKVRQSAACPVDRLTLMPASEPPSHPRLHVYTLTPETSAPRRGGRRRDGQKEERALIHGLVEKLWPEVLSDFGPDVFQGQAQSSWSWLVPHGRTKANNAKLREAFRASVRREFELEPEQSVPEALRRIPGDEREQTLELIASLRNALAASAIENIQPDLVIFDEFQRFRDMLDDQEDEASARVVERLRGERMAHRPGLLLLSATPYRLFSRRWEDAAGASHHREFFDLVEFLYGSDQRAKTRRAECEASFVRLADALRRGDLASDQATRARAEVEGHLRPIMCRTERASHEHGWVDYHTTPKDAHLHGDDIKVFRHLSDSLDDRHRSGAVHYWSSIPLPMQTMGRRYVVWQKASPKPAKRVPQLTGTHAASWTRPDRWPHAKLRALEQLMPPAKLVLPWVRPSLGWWPLAGRWSDDGGDKLLVFSHFRAVPQAIGALMSYGVEQAFLEQSGLEYGKVTRYRLLQASDNRTALLGLFHPSPWLAANTDPLGANRGSMDALRESMREQTAAALRDAGIRIGRDGRSQPVARVLAQIEHRLGLWDDELRAWESLADAIGKGDKREAGLRGVLKQWDELAREPIEAVTEGELHDLAELALGGPGVVLARALHRHWDLALDPQHGDATWRDTLFACWVGLRSYLDNQIFAAAFRSPDAEKYPAAIMEAVVDGNLEAVLDEHLWITSQLRSVSGADLAAELRDGLTVRTSVFGIRHPSDRSQDSFNFRCHAALPFTEARVSSAKSEDGTESERSFRPDELRKAFNTPFWPHILATTSVGQEGLDFHAWCSSLLHWDLCGSPVDLEQREGRIQRYGGLSVRRAVANELRADALTDPTGSPWIRLAQLANERLSDPSGLCPWWVCKDAKIVRYVFDTPTSAAAHKLAWLKEQRLLYRLVLGQPNQEDLLEVLREKSVADPDGIRQAALGLSPFFNGY